MIPFGLAFFYSDCVCVCVYASQQFVVWLKKADTALCVSNPRQDC